MMSRNIQNPYIYAVIPVYNEEALIESFLRDLAAKLEKLTLNYRIVVINDGSSDKSKDIIQSLANELNIKFISFSRNFGKEVAITAGLAASKDADAAIIMDCDFQHPIELLDKFYQKWCEGYANIYGVRTRNDQTFLKSFLSKSFYTFSKKFMKIDIPADAGDFRILDKQVIKALNLLPEKSRFMKGLYAWVGFKGYAIPFEVPGRKDGTESRWNYNKLFGLAITGIFSFSSVPLRLISVLGIVISIFALTYGFYIFVQSLFLNVNVTGWPTIVVSIMFFSGVQLISLGVLGEYISRIFDEAKKRPTYIIDENESRNI
ncbi:MULTISPECIES: glycosyltransferase family 2 protein [Francisella]|uniref:Glycosyltransferase n=1 Tax=Francisella opportunistica TaxID=2016517 RepID=A0A345JSC2_9GAMM|nr:MULTISPECIES: glycosyltransferase family 2 protein [Francisella]APC91982.1 Polymyxin resistance protein ArnC, glycosyl transferase [Francisella sp. MA067296]AXH30218.1 glycosyltransferase [Francisella opportunistica]AXH31859.1 glycosyltransferase [Francisella opportunistica]AXH33505.1 glycosyltransferase [Francisella opportunistica]